MNDDARLITRIDGAVGTVVLSNVRKHNAMTMAMWQELPVALAALDIDSSVRVIVLEGDGDRAFVSGSDISQFESERSSGEKQAVYNAAVDAAHAAPGRCAKPVLAKIRGICYGGGIGLAIGCDLLLCSSDARFRIPAARMGIGYPPGSIRRLVSLVGAQQSLDILASARTFGADEAARIGLVARVIDAASFDTEVAEWAGSVAQNAPLTVRAVKLTIQELQSNSSAPPSAKLLRDITACFDSADYREGARAFMEKRSPAFEGR